jgi:hypothetical protein
LQCRRSKLWFPRTHLYMLNSSARCSRKIVVHTIENSCRFVTPSANSWRLFKLNPAIVNEISVTKYAGSRLRVSKRVLKLDIRTRDKYSQNTHVFDCHSAPEIKSKLRFRLIWQYSLPNHETLVKVKMSREKNNNLNNNLKNHWKKAKKSISVLKQQFAGFIYHNLHVIEEKGFKVMI